jgi:hypothetical protein
MWVFHQRRFITQVLAHSSATMCIFVSSGLFVFLLSCCHMRRAALQYVPSVLSGVLMSAKNMKPGMYWGLR